MSHYFGIEEIRTKLIVVTGLALSGEGFCKRYRMGLMSITKSIISQTTQH